MSLGMLPLLFSKWVLITAAIYSTVGAEDSRNQTFTISTLSKVFSGFKKSLY